MADLASSAVTVVNSWSNGGVNGKRHVEEIVTLVLTGQGDSTDKILATALGFTKIEQCGNAVLDDDSIVYIASPSYDGSHILLVDPTESTDASRVPVAVTGTVRLFVAGYR